MPRTRSRRSYRPRRRRRGFTRRRSPWRAIKRLRRDTQPELKQTTIPFSIVPLNAGSAWSTNNVLSDFFDQIAVGGDSFNRIGRRITVRKIRLVGTMAIEAASGGPIQGFTRTILFIDKNPKQAPPAVAEMFELPAVPIHTAWATANIKQYKILKDKVHAWNNVTGPSVRYLKVKKRLRTVVEYDGNTGAIADLTKNNLCFGFTWVPGPPMPVSPGTGAVKFGGQIKIWYSDL